MRAIGHRLDEMSAESIIITELNDVLIVAGRGQSEVRLAASIEPFQMFLRQHDIEYLLTDAFRRRGIAPRRQHATRDPKRAGLKSIFQRLN